MKKTIVISLADMFANKVTDMVANDLGLYFLNLDDFIDYRLLDYNRIIEKCGVEYLKKQEAKYIKEAFSFVEAIYYISYDLFVNNQIYFADCLIIYIALTCEQLAKLNEKTFVINNLAFQDRDAYLRSIGLVIEGDFLVEKSFSNKIIQKLKQNDYI
ncbi:MAG: hypothetical protein PHX09_03440 [Clostridia bacterium]|nr:hypothetical protein [Clostridia bacterium]MDD4686309.1 hypothetical protein [Clostridia bacterium]